jgi:hypothetical protein
MKPRFEDEIRAELGAQRSSAGPIEVMHLGQRIRF